jgi:hypothetical protein
MKTVHADNGLITADCDSSKRQTRPLFRELPISISLQMSDSNKNVLLSPGWVVQTRTEWPTLSLT